MFSPNAHRPRAAGNTATRTGHQLLAILSMEAAPLQQLSSPRKSTPRTVLQERPGSHHPHPQSFTQFSGLCSGSPHHPRCQVSPRLLQDTSQLPSCRPGESGPRQDTKFPAHRAGSACSSGPHRCSAQGPLSVLSDLMALHLCIHLLAAMSLGEGLSTRVLAQAGWHAGKPHAQGSSQPSQGCQGQQAHTFTSFSM